MVMTVPESSALQVDDLAAACFHQLVGLDPEHVVPGARGRPHLGPKQQVGIDEHPQVRRVTEGRHSTDGM
jgi:hypothetical protein